MDASYSGLYEESEVEHINYGIGPHFQLWLLICSDLIGTHPVQPEAHGWPPMLTCSFDTLILYKLAFSEPSRIFLQWIRDVYVCLFVCDSYSIGEGQRSTTGEITVSQAASSDYAGIDYKQGWVESEVDMFNFAFLI